MIETEQIKVTKTEDKTVKAFCDFCGKEFDETNIMCNGFGQMTIGFGFGSSFDDDHFHLEICDRCFINQFYEKLMPQFKEKGYNIDEVKLNKYDNVKK